MCAVFEDKIVQYQWALHVYFIYIEIATVYWVSNKVQLSNKVKNTKTVQATCSFSLQRGA